jgi:hypothetical protein
VRALHEASEKRSVRGRQAVAKDRKSLFVIMIAEEKPMPVKRQREKVAWPIARFVQRAA